MCNSHNEEELEEKSEITEDRAWPEEPNANTSWLALICKRWTYAYMRRVLDKGSRQMLPDGSHLSEQDLYVVPDSMKSAFLIAKFR